MPLIMTDLKGLDSTGDNAVTSSIRIAQVCPELVGKKTHAIRKVYGGNVKLYN